MAENALVTQSKQFAVDIINLCEDLHGRRKANAIIDQLLRSGTSIGANIHEANYGASKSDFINKLQIALKECYETDYWLELLYESGYLSRNIFESMYRDNLEINRILASIIITAHQNLKRQLKPKTE